VVTAQEQARRREQQVHAVVTGKVVVNVHSCLFMSWIV